MLMLLITDIYNLLHCNSISNSLSLFLCSFVLLFYGLSSQLASILAYLWHCFRAPSPSFLSACQYSCLFVALLQSTIFFISPLFLTIASVFVSISIAPTIQLCLSYSACLLVTTLKNTAHAIIWNNKPGYPVFPTILFWSLIWIICVIYGLNHSCSLIDPFFVCSPTQKLMQPNCWIFILPSKLDCCFISM